MSGPKRAKCGEFRANKIKYLQRLLREGVRNGSPQGDSAAWRGSLRAICAGKVEEPEPAISRVLSMTVIHLGQPSPAASSNLPGSPFGTDGDAPLFGLAPGGVYRAANCYQSRGALLPHLFTLTGRGRRYIFCGTFRGLTPPRRYLAPCPKEPGLSSAANCSDCLANSGSSSGAFYSNRPVTACQVADFSRSSSSRS